MKKVVDTVFSLKIPTAVNRKVVIWIPYLVVEERVQLCILVMRCNYFKYGNDLRLAN